MEKHFDLLQTEETPKSTNFDALLTIAIKGQKALTVRQLFTMERIFKNWDNWKIKLAVWLIRKTKL